MMPHPLLLRLALVAFGLLGSLVIVEVGLRVVRLPLAGFASDALKTRRHSPVGKPDFRGRAYRFATADEGDVFRLVVVGDSFTWGHGVLEEDAFPDRMAARLALERSDPPVEVINFSRPGWNTTRALRSLRFWMDRLDPDAIVLGYCLNDAEPIRAEALRRLRRDIESRTPASSLSRTLYEGSRVYRLLFDRLEALRLRRALAHYYHRLYQGRGWAEAREALAGFERQARKRGIPLLMVVFPLFDSQLDRRYRYEDLHALIRATGAELEIDTLDLLPVYRGLDARRLASVPFTDAHPSEIAHRIAAAAILRHLVDRGVLAATVGENGERKPAVAGAPLPASSDETATGSVAGDAGSAEEIRRDAPPGGRE